MTNITCGDASCKLRFFYLVHVINVTIVTCVTPVVEKTRLKSLINLLFLNSYKLDVDSLISVFLQQHNIRQWEKENKERRKTCLTFLVGRPVFGIALNVLFDNWKGKLSERVALINLYIYMCIKKEYHVLITLKLFCCCFLQKRFLLLVAFARVFDRCLSLSFVSVPFGAMNIYFYLIIIYQMYLFLQEEWNMMISLSWYPFL